MIDAIAALSTSCYMYGRTLIHALESGTLPMDNGLSTLVLAPALLLRCVDDEIHIYTPTSDLQVFAFNSSHAHLIAWLLRFRKPTSITDALATLPKIDHPLGVEAISRLKRQNILVEAKQWPAPERLHDDECSRNRSLPRISRELYDIACDSRGFGTFAERNIASRTGVGVHDRLLQILEATRAISRELRSMRQDYLSDQIRALGLTDKHGELQLHIGDARRVLDGWVNIDTFPAPLAMNPLWDLPLGDSSARCVLVSHISDVLFFRIELRKYFSEIRRVLIRGGTVRVNVPATFPGEACDTGASSSQGNMLGAVPEKRTHLEHILSAAMPSKHQHRWKANTLVELLKEERFVNVHHVSRARSEFRRQNYDDPFQNFSSEFSAYIQGSKPLQ